jgi:hypothetical protein
MSYAGDALLISAIALVLLAPLCHRFVTRRLDPFEPFLVFVIAYGVMFVVRPASMLAQHKLVFEGPVRPLDVSPHFTRMLVLALVGAVSFTIGYVLPVSRRLAGRNTQTDDQVDRRRLILLVGACTAAGLLAFAAFAASGDGTRTFGEILHADKTALAAGEGTYRYLWLGFFVLVPAAAVLYALGLELRRPVIVICAAALGFVVLLNVLPLGNRTVLLPLLGAFFVLYYLERGRRPRWRMLALLALIAVFVSPFLSDLRGRGTRGEGITATIARTAKPSRLAQPFTTGPDSEMAPALAAALSVVPDRIPYQHGRVIFEDLVFRPVPRALWNGKPQIPRDKLIKAIWPVEAARGALNPEFSVLLYFYWDFGIVGVVLGMAVFGMGARYLYQHFCRRKDLLSSRVIFALSLWFVVIGLRDSPVDTIVWAAFLVFPAWVILRAARVPVRHKSTAAISLEPRASP